MFVGRKAGYEPLTSQRAHRGGDTPAVDQDLQIAGARPRAIDLELDGPSNRAIRNILHSNGPGTSGIAVYGSKSGEGAVSITRGGAMAIALGNHMLAGFLNGFRISTGLVRIRIVRM